MRPVRYAVAAGSFLAAVAANWARDRCASMAAALAFYAAFSLAPMLVIVISVAGFFLARMRYRDVFTPKSRR